MNFLNPEYLFLLFLILPLVLLYVLKLRRKTYVVSSSLLWEQAIEDLKANTPFQRLRKNILLPLQILILALIVFALAAPFLRGFAGVGQNLILVLDGSASMKAKDIGESRFDAAKSAAQKIVDSLGKGSKAMIVEAASPPSVVSGFSSDKLLLRDTIARMQATDAPGGLHQAINLAISASRDLQNVRILILTDQPEKLDRYNNDAGAEIHFVAFGKKDAANLGIIDFEVTQSAFEPAKRQAFLALKNFGTTERRSVSLELWHDQDLIDVRELSFAAGERRSVVFDDLEFQDGILEARIDARDDFDTDNQAYYVLTKRRQIRTLLITKGNRFLESAIRATFPQMPLSERDVSDFRGSDGFDITVLDGIVPSKLSSRNTFIVSPSGDLPFATFVSQSDSPTVIDWSRTHPTMRFLDLSGLKIKNVRNYQMPSWMLPLIDTDGGTAAWAGEHAGRRVIVLAFDIRPGESNNFSMLAAFPIFVSNALNWLAGSALAPARHNVQAGQVVELPAPGVPDGQAIVVTKPDGTKLQTMSHDGNVLFEKTDLVGLYRFAGKNFNDIVAVNLTDENESDIIPKEMPDIATGTGTNSRSRMTVNRELWPFLILAALLFLALEWWFYHRRVFV